MSVTQSVGGVPLFPTPVYPWPNWTRTDFALVTGLVLAGLALRLPGLNQGLWVDEIFSLVDFIRLQPLDIINNPGYKNNHVLYSLSAHYSIAWFGESVWALRFPAFLFGVAAIPSVYLLGRQLASRSEAFLAALFMAVGYHFIWYSQSARGYTGLLFGALLATILFIRLVTAAKPSRWIVIGYAVVAALTVWVHLTAVFLVLAHGLIWFALTLKLDRELRIKTSAPTFVGLLLTGALTLTFYLPLFVGEVAQHFDGKRAASRLSELPGSAEWVLTEFAIGLERSMPGGWPVIVVVIAVVLVGLVSYAKQGMSIIALLVLPGLTVAAFISMRSGWLFPRFLYGSAGFLLLIGVRGGFTLAEMVLPFLTKRAVLYIGIVFALAAASMVPGAWKPKQDFVAAVHFLQQNRQADDALVCFGAAKPVLIEYFGLECEAVNTLAELNHIESQHQRTWLIYTLREFSINRLTEIAAAIDMPSRYQLAGEFPGSLGGGTITVLLHERGDPVAGTHAGVPQPMLNSALIRLKFGSYGVDVLEQDAQSRVSSLYSMEANEKITRTLAVVIHDQDIPEQLLAEHNAIVNGASIGEAFKQAGWHIEKQNLHFGGIAASAGCAGVYSLMGLAGPELLAVHVYDLWLSKGIRRFRYAAIAEIHHPGYLDAEMLSDLFDDEYQALRAISPPVQKVLDEVTDKLHNLPQPTPVATSGLMRISPPVSLRWARASPAIVAACAPVSPTIIPIFAQQSFGIQLCNQHPHGIPDATMSVWNDAAGCISGFMQRSPGIQWYI